MARDLSKYDKRIKINSECTCMGTGCISLLRLRMHLTPSSVCNEISTFLTNGLQQVFHSFK